MKKQILVLACLMGLLNAVWAGQRGAFIDSESNIREGPGKEKAILKVSTKGVSFDILETQGKWAKIRLEDGLVGWTNAINFVILKEETKKIEPKKESGSKALAPVSELAGSEKIVSKEPGMAFERPDQKADIERWLDAVKKDPKNPVPQFMLGMAYLDGGMKTEARKQATALRSLHQTLADDLSRLIGN